MLNESALNFFAMALRSSVHAFGHKHEAREFIRVDFSCPREEVGKVERNTILD